MIISSKLDDDHNMAKIYIDIIYDNYDKPFIKITARQIILDTFYYCKFIGFPEKTNWMGGNVIFMRKLNTHLWYRYSWLLDIDLENPYIKLDDYKILDRKIFYRFLNRGELTQTLKKVKPYLNHTVLYELLKNEELILLKRVDTNINYENLHIAIPDSQIRWMNYELLWIFNFYHI